MRKHMYFAVCQTKGGGRGGGGGEGKNLLRFPMVLVLERVNVVISTLLLT